MDLPRRIRLLSSVVCLVVARAMVVEVIDGLSLFIIYTFGLIIVTHTNIGFLL